MKILFFTLLLCSCIYSNYTPEYWLNRMNQITPWWPIQRSTVKHTDIIFIKTHKTASSTVSSVLHRYCGENKNVTCFVPKNDGGTMTEPRNGPATLYAYNPKYVNVHAQHTYYWPTFLHRLVPEPAPVITIIRKPASRFLSTWDYRKFSWRGRHDILNIIEKMPAERSSLPSDFLRFVKHDSAQYELCPSEPAWAISNSSEPTCVQTLRDIVNGKLGLVLLTERLDEGMVLLSRMMGWSLRSVLYWSMKVSGHKDQHDKPLASTFRKLEHWLQLDMLLYELAEDIFDRRIQSQDSSFWSELEEFKDLKEQMIEACESRKGDSHFTEAECRRIRQDNVAWVIKEHQRLKEQYLYNKEQGLRGISRKTDKK